MAGAIVAFWLIADGVALRYFVSVVAALCFSLCLTWEVQILFIGVMSDLYVLWDVSDLPRL